MNRRAFLQLSMAVTAAAAFPACTGIMPASSRSSAKRGLGIPTTPGNHWREKLQLCGAHWFYSWGSTPPENIPAGLEFVPMVWGGKPGDSFTKLGEQLRTAGYQQLLGLNEPDNMEQSNVTVEDALSLWPKLMDMGLRLGCPACVHPDGEWMKAFIKGVEERHLRVDFVAVHSYGGLSAGTFLPYMDNPYLKPFTHSAMVAGALSVMVLIIVSLFTKPSSAAQLATTTIQGATFAEADEKVAWYASYRLWLGLAIACSAGLWIWFSR